MAGRFREALACFSSGLWQAFSAMCRETAQAVFVNVGEAGRMQVFERVTEVRELGNIDDSTFNAVRRLIFEADASSQEKPAIGVQRQYYWKP